MNLEKTKRDKIFLLIFGLIITIFGFWYNGFWMQMLYNIIFVAVILIIKKLMENRV